jgi:hypothetical protein
MMGLVKQTPYRKSYSDPYAQPRQFGRSNVPHALRKTEVRAKIIKRVNEYKDGCWMIPTEPPRSPVPMPSE